MTSTSTVVVPARAILFDNANAWPGLRVSARIARLASQPGAVAPRRLSTTALTPREVEVLRLIAAGRLTKSRSRMSCRSPRARSTTTSLPFRRRQALATVPRPRSLATSTGFSPAECDALVARFDERRASEHASSLLPLSARLGKPIGSFEVRTQEPARSERTVTPCPDLSSCQTTPNQELDDYATPGSSHPRHRAERRCA